MKEINKDILFRLYDVREDGEGIDLILYMLNLDVEKDYTISTQEKHKTGDIDFKKACINHNSKEILAISEICMEYRDLFNLMPNSTKVKRCLQVIENIIWNFYGWFKENNLDFPIGNVLTSSKGKFEYLDDYTIVRLDGKEHRLSPVQSKVIQLLHEAYLSENPYLDFYIIRSKVYTNHQYMNYIFKKNKPAMNDLILYDRTLQKYRLNI